MASRKALLNLLIFGCFYYPLSAGAGSNPVDSKPELVKSTLEAAFSVNNKTVIPEKSNKRTCKTDNAYMLSALNAKKINIKNYNYSVRVSVKDFLVTSGSREIQLLFHYEIELPDFTKVTQKEFPALVKTDFIKSHVPLSEPPTTCYIFTGNRKLNLLCHYGFEAYKAMPEIIHGIKSQSP